MKFKTDVVPWISEVKSYLKDGKKKIGEIKKTLKSVDFSNLDYLSRVKLSSLFDPRCEISEEIFKRELNLYFALLESKNAPIKLPVFSDYIDWIYSQDIGHLSDSTFYLISSRLLKTSATDFSEAIRLFLSRLPSEFDKDIDTFSNYRLNTLIYILNETKYDYEHMPEEYKRFVKRMFLACAVKTEITDKNQYNFRGIFKENPRYYFSILNKAFAGFKEYESWVDDPAKRLNFRNMVNYANFQDQVLANTKYGLKYSNFASCADDLNLPGLPDYDPNSVYFGQYYLRHPRDYISYAKRMSKLFVKMVTSEVEKAASLYRDGTLSQEYFKSFAVTNRMKENFSQLDLSKGLQAFVKAFSDELVSMVHLDELSGLSYKEIYEKSMHKLKKDKEVSKSAQPETKTTFSKHKHSQKSDKYDFHKQIHGFTLEERIENNCCEPNDLSELYERYYELLSQGKRNIELENVIFDLEVRIKENQQDEIDDSEEIEKE